MDRPDRQPRRLFGIGAHVLRAALVAAWAAASVALLGADALALSPASRGLFPILLALAAIILALAAVFILLARHRLDLGWPTLMVAGAATLQFAAAWTRPPPTSISPSTAPDPQTLAAAGVTVLCFGLILLHASWVLTSDEPRAPFGARLRAWGRSFRFNPVALLFGPVFQKEVRVVGRKRSTYVVRALYPLLLLGIAAFAYGSMTLELDAVSGAERLQRLQEFAPVLTLVIAWCQFAVLSFLAPVMTAPAICDERRRLTLPALMTTPMTSSQIIFGKLTSRLVLVVILALASTPLLLAIRIYGGLEAEVIAATTCISLSTAVLGASLGLLFSVWHRRAASAAILGLLTMSLFTAAVIVAVFITSARSVGPPAPWLLGLSAPTAMFGVTAATFEPPPVTGGLSYITQVWVTSAVVNLTIAFFACAAATLALRSVLRAEAAGELAAVTDRPRARKGRPAAPPTAPGADAPDAPAGAGHDGHARSGVTRVVGDHPVLWREIRQASFGSRKRLIIVAAAVFLAALFIYSRVPFSDGLLHAMVGMIGVFVVLLQASVASTASIAGEFESRTWHVLLTTPLTAREIVAGKFLGGLRRQWFVLACLAAHFLVAAAAGHVPPITLLHLALLYIAPALMLTGAGLLLSLLLRRSTAAAVANLLLALTLWLVLPVAAAAAFEGFGLRIGRGRRLAEFTFDALMSINPVVMCVIAVSPVAEAHHYADPAALYNFPSGRVSTTTFTLILAATSTIGALIGLGCAFVATRLFHRVGGRTS